MKYCIVLSIVLAGFLSACNVLEQDPVSEIAIDQAFKSDVDMRAAVVGVYNRLAQETNAGAHAEMSRRYLYMGELRSDSYTSRVPGNRNIIKGEINNVYPHSNWGNFYTAVRALNNILYYGQQIPDGKFASEKEKNRLFGEAYFLRAFVYFQLLRGFDNVVLFTNPYLDTEANFTNPQVAPAETMKQIEADLLEAVRLLPPDYPAANRGRATLGAAHALMAKFYVYISSPYNQQKLNVAGQFPAKWKEAAEYADLVIANKALYNLVPARDYTSIFVQNGTTESIWEIVYEGSIPGPNTENDFVTDFLPQKNSAPAGGQFQYQPSDKLIDAFTNMQDTIRFNAAMAEVTAAGGWDKRDIGKSMPTLKYRNHYVKKYTGNILGNRRFSDNNILMLRLADVYLLKAEALFEMGETGKAQEALDWVTKRANIGSRPVSVDEILQQRWLELCFEGDRWYDLKRRNLLEKETGAHAAFPKGYTFPIINGEMINNPNVKQNEGW